jgi:Spy/CpxP family protein refolding chaperone
VTYRLTLLHWLLFSLVAQSSLSYASSLYWWNDDKVIAALSLTDTQRKTIDNLVQESLKKRGEIKKRLTPLQRVIPDLLSQSPLDERKILSTLSTQDELQAARRREVVLLRMQVRKVLSEEQFKKLLTLNPVVMRQQWVTPPIQVEIQGRPSSVSPGTSPPEKEKEEGDLP